MVDYKAMVSSIGNKLKVYGDFGSISHLNESSDGINFCELRTLLSGSTDGACGITLSEREVKVVRTVSEPIMIQRLLSSEPSTPTPMNSVDESF